MNISVNGNSGSKRLRSSGKRTASLRIRKSSLRFCFMSIFLIQLFFRCHEESPLIHPVGWARRVGHQVVANQDYFDRCAMDNYISTDCTPDMFPEYRQAHMNNLVPGMKLEAVDPLNLATICVATVMKVLR